MAVGGKGKLRGKGREWAVLGRRQYLFLGWEGVNLGPYLLQQHTDEGLVEAGGLRVQCQHRLLVLEQHLSTGLGVCLLLWQRDRVAWLSVYLLQGDGGEN